MALPGLNLQVDGTLLVGGIIIILLYNYSQLILE